MPRLLAVVAVHMLLLHPQTSRAKPFAFVQFVHAANVDEIEISVDGIPMVRNMAYLTATSLKPVFHGSHLVTAYIPGTDDHPASRTIRVLFGYNYVVAVVGTPGNLEIIVRSEVRFTARRSIIDYFGLNAALDAGHIDIRLLNPRSNNEIVELVYNNFPFARFGAYRGLPLGSHTFEVTSADNSHLIGHFHFQISGYSGQVVLMVTAGRGITPEEGFLMVAFDKDGLVIHSTVVTKTEDSGTPHPDLTLSLSPAWPNPARQTVRVAYTLPEDINTRLEIADVLGRPVATLQDGLQRAGTHSARWDGQTDLGARASPGVYIWRMTAGESHIHRPFVLVR